jgi:hypothetical protein
MSDFTDDYAAAAEELESYFAGEISYQDKNTSLTSGIPATIHRDRRERRQNSDGGFDWITVRDIVIFDHTTPSIVTVRRDATVTISGQNYSILEISDASEGRRKLKLQRTQKAEVARNEYRRN